MEAGTDGEAAAHPAAGHGEVANDGTLAGCLANMLLHQGGPGLFVEVLDAVIALLPRPDIGQLRLCCRAGRALVRRCTTQLQARFQASTPEPDKLLDALADSFPEVTSLRIVAEPGWQPVIDAPRFQLGGLTELHIGGSSKKEARAFGSPGLLRACPALRRLSMSTISVAFPSEEWATSLLNLCHLQELVLWDLRNVEVLRQGLPGLTALTSLRFVATAVKEDFAKLLDDISSHTTQLQKLSLTCSVEMRFSHRWAQMQNLRDLEIGRGWQKMMSPTICQLSSLTALRLLCLPNLQEIPLELGVGLRQLRELSVGSCINLKELPTSLGKLSLLTALCLMCLPNLETIPSSVGVGLTQLKKMTVASCIKVSELSESLGQLSALTALRLLCLPNLETVPWGAGLSRGQLKELTVAYCDKLEELPRGITQLSELRMLDLSGCNGLIGLNRSRSSTGATAAASLPDVIWQLSSLTELRLQSFHFLPAVSKSLGQLVKLVKLNLSECRSLAALPETIDQLTGLKKLDIRDCVSLQSLPDLVNTLTCLVH